jgi:hypothetical protein
VGYQSLYNNSTGTSNVAVGWNAADANTTGSAITAVGEHSLGGNSTGSDNTACGREALKNNTTADNNTAVGTAALKANTTGTQSTAVGMSAGNSVTTANQVTYIGCFSGESATGEGNTFVGSASGQLITSGTKNTIVGRYNGNQGGLDLRTSSNYIVLSDGDGNPRVQVEANGNILVPQTYNNTTGSGANMYVHSDGRFYRSTSSLRYKNTINDATHGLTELLALRPVTYKGNYDGDTTFGGLIAEEVHDAGLTEFVQYDDDDRPDALAYGNMVSLCIKAIQEQQETITALEARIATLEAE